MSIYDLPNELPSINGAASRYECVQIVPTSGNLNSVVLGTGNATGLSSFIWNDSVLWWSPCLSYWRMRVQFTKANATPLLTDYTAYADNFISLMFQNIKSHCNSRQIDMIDFPHIVDTVMTYSNSKKTFLDSYGSVTHVGEGFQTRLVNTCSNGGVVEVCFRPPLALMQCKNLPPGAQWKIDFSWAQNQAALFESLVGDVATSTASVPTGQQFQVKILDFSFFKATTQPSPMVELPQQAVLDLNPAIVNQYFLNQGGNSLRQTLTLPSTTNTIYVTLQDTNSTALATPVLAGTTTTPGVGTGYNPQTSFAYAVSSGSTSSANLYAAVLQNLYLNLPELGIQIPNPTYQFTGASGNEWQRAYMDFINISQGTNTASEGSIPLGTYDISAGCAITSLNAGALLAQAGNPLNKDQASIFTTAATISPMGATAFAPGATTFNQSARFGWLGRCPGPIFGFQCVRPENKAVTTGTLNATFSAAVVNCVFNVICVYSMALQLNHLGGGLYSYNLLEGV